MKIIYVAILVVFVISSLIMYFYTNKFGRKGLESTILDKCIGVIDSIDSKQASKYYMVNGEKHDFGWAGREMLQYAEVGDSIKKYQDSTYVELIKYNKSDSLVLKMTFEIN